MNEFRTRFKFYSIGLVIGIGFVIVFFGERLSCSQYLPNGRVFEEVKNKPIHLMPAVAQSIASITKSRIKYPNDSLKAKKMDSLFIMDSLFTEGTIAFDESQVRLQPCGKYILYYPDNKKYKLEFTKCKKEVVLDKLVELK